MLVLALLNEMNVTLIQFNADEPISFLAVHFKTLFKLMVDVFVT